MPLTLEKILCSLEVNIAKKISQNKLKALKIAEFILDKKAKHPVILDVSKISNICDYFIICSAETGVQAQAIFSYVREKCRESNLEIHHHEHDELSDWVLVDFFDIILHIFVGEAREFYNLEHLWSDAKRVRMPRRKAVAD